jgi:hypothetical protein
MLSIITLNIAFSVIKTGCCYSEWSASIFSIIMFSITAFSIIKCRSAECSAFFISIIVFSVMGPFLGIQSSLSLENICLVTRRHDNQHNDT